MLAGVHESMGHAWKHAQGPRHYGRLNELGAGAHDAHDAHLRSSEPSGTGRGCRAFPSSVRLERLGMQPLYPGRVASAHETIDPNALVHKTMTRSESVAGPRACPTTATLPVPGPDDLGERASACPLAEWRKPVRKMQFLGHVPGRRRGVHLGGAMVDTNDFGVVDTNDFGVEEDRIRAAYGRRRDDGRYAWSNPALLFIMQDLERRVLRLLAREGVLPLHDKHILEVGCGTGYWLRQFVKWGPIPSPSPGATCLPTALPLHGNSVRVGFALSTAMRPILPFPAAAFMVPASSPRFTPTLT